MYKVIISYYNSKGDIILETENKQEAINKLKELEEDEYCDYLDYCQKCYDNYERPADFYPSCYILTSDNVYYDITNYERKILINMPTTELSNKNNLEVCDIRDTALNRAVELIYARDAYRCTGYFCINATTCFEKEKQKEICLKCIKERLLNPEESL